MPLRTWRWSRHRPPRRGVIAGSKGASRSHSSSVISNRRFTAGFYRTTCAQSKPTQRSEKHALAAVWHRIEQYADNRIEADHGRLKARLRPTRGLKHDRNATVVIAGHAVVQNLRHDATGWPPRSQQIGAWRSPSMSLRSQPEPERVGASARHELAQRTDPSWMPGQAVPIQSAATRAMPGMR